MLPFALYNLNLERLRGIKGTGVYVAVNRHISDRKLEYLLLTNSSLIDGPFFNKHVALRVTVGTTCCLSMLGALLIIISYFLIRDIRTKSRQILVHLSIADFGVSCSNFIGVSVYFDQYIRHCPEYVRAPRRRPYEVADRVNSALSCGALQGLCKAQAFFAGFSTLASVLWTVCLAVYIYCLVVHSSKKVHHKVVYISYLLCWGVPLLISIWLISTGKACRHTR